MKYFQSAIVDQEMFSISGIKFPKINLHSLSNSILHSLCLKVAFHFRVFHTHVYARKTLNPSTLYIF